MSFLSTAIVSGLLSRLLSWKAIVILYLPLVIILWVVLGDQSKQMESQGVMSVSIDPETKLPIIDITTNNPLGEQSFHAAVYDKDFVIKGVQTTIVITQKNPEKNARNKEDYEIHFYSDILNSNCLVNLQKAVEKTPIEGVSIEDLVINVCGKAVFPYQISKPSSQVANYEVVNNFCTSQLACASCLIVSGQESINGICEPQKANFHDWSRYIRDENSGRFIFDVRPTKKLSYMTHVPR